MFDLLNESIRQKINLTPTEFEAIVKYFTLKTFERKEVLIHANTICSEIFFINKGCTRSFHLTRNNYEQVLQIAFEGWWISEIPSFISEQPSKVSIEAIEPLEVLSITKQNRQEMFREVPAIEGLFRILAENAYAALQQRILDNFSKSAEERYIELLERYPSISQRVPQRDIASYLGIQPPSLSRIRRRIIDREKR